ncbi:MULTISPECIES: hypothetical protein [Streptococcus]|jgi:hypothetical protein|uniref:Uncharacterized protein n=1 Tax=Streptococcus mitis 13/39 TaxID=1239793 RepID=R0NLN6_STRMT|nr:MULTISPECIES: hypothetical protein [Streptococcus]EOB30854.1 hypothetical protein D065_10374 [Streptococcus mitis 13/39]DAR72720.1 MAG TPA: hypothetical protein [Caudoviricetes sp.]MDK6636806.1 hypothetical protein [Streptococcus mitis]MDK7133352.1 hypothetical protein [Streptococcus mitis]DAU05165.1 MAG TPA: hypothetical protein [Caudoviricetes sp.]
MIQKTEQLKDLLDRGFVLFSKNGIIESAKLPEFGSLIIKTQDGKPIQKETRQKEKI